MKKIRKPSLLVDEFQVRANIKKLAAKAKKHQLSFRPHFKTHQSITIGNWFKEYGVSQITVSSIEMAYFFAKNGWNDITIAFPINILEIEQLNELAASIKIQVLLESEEVAIFLGKRLKSSIGVFIKIDTGYNRTGILSDSILEIEKLIQLISLQNKLRFEGFLIHSGHSYKCRSKEEVLDVHNDSLRKLQKLKSIFIGAYPDLIISYGDTPTCSIAEDFAGIDEIRPGNFVFYDLTQVKIGSCELAEIATLIVCPIVAMHEGRSELVIYGGGVHLSKERLQLEDGSICYGLVSKSKEFKGGSNSWDNSLISLSQEHGIAKVCPEFYKKCKVGDLIFILPIHSCMSANLLYPYRDQKGRKVI